jgi:hypothetical protein
MSQFSDIDLGENGIAAGAQRKVTVSWENVSVIAKSTYSQKVKSVFSRKDYTKPLITGVSGIVRPGELVALMGARYINIRYFSLTNIGIISEKS